MENQPIENYIDIILKGLYNNRPSPFIIEYLFPDEYDIEDNEHRQMVYEAKDIMLQNGLIVDNDGEQSYYKATPLGLEVYRNGGYTKYKERIEAEKAREAQTKQLTYEKLIEDLKKVRDENKFFRWVSVAALVLTLLQLMLKMFGK